MPDFLQLYAHLLPYALIPVVAAVVGWFTNVLAIKMTFYPLEFKGVKPFGWQGIIPSKAGSMAGKSVDLMVGKLIDLDELFGHIDPKRIAEEMEPSLMPLGERIVKDTMEQQSPLLWNSIPPLVKKRIYKQATDDLPEVIEETMNDLQGQITEIFDIRGMAVKELTANKALLNEIFLECGSEEFKFIEKSGFYFGFLFGLLQMIAWYLIGQWWLLPLGGLIVGFATNWLALKLIFEPKEPIKIGRIVFQGLFMKRQKEVAKEYANLVTKNLFTPTKIFRSILQGPTSDKLLEIVQKHVRNAVDKSSGYSKTFIQLTAGTKKYDKIKNIATERLIEQLPRHVIRTFDYAEKALAIEQTLREKMTELSPREYEGFLRPAFQEDEWKLILTGAILGGLAGLAQLLMF